MGRNDRAVETITFFFGKLAGESESVTVPRGTTLGQFIKDKNILEGSVRVNVYTRRKDYKLRNNDMVVSLPSTILGCICASCSTQILEGKNYTNIKILYPDTDAICSGHSGLRSFSATSPKSGTSVFGLIYHNDRGHNKIIHVLKNIAEAVHAGPCQDKECTGELASRHSRLGKGSCAS